MTVPGVDYSWGRPDPAELYRLGYRFAARYVSYDNTGKNLTPGERDALIDAGIAIVLNWEHAAGDAKGGYNAGLEHGRQALDMAIDLGMPDDRPIYFSVDFDMPDSQANVVGEYFAGVNAILPMERIGIYGGYKAICYAVDRDWARWLWQTYAWSYGNWHPANHFEQWSNGHYIAGADVDKNRARQSDIGQWGVDDVSAKDVWTYDVDPAGTAYTASGALWTVFNRSDYLANDFAGAVMDQFTAVNLQLEALALQIAEIPAGGGGDVCTEEQIRAIVRDELRCLLGGAPRTLRR